MTARNYELMFILNPGLNEEETEVVLQKIRGYLDEGNGEVLYFESWGLRKMAYTIKNHREGRYYLMQFTMETLKVKEFERNLLLLEDIVREQIIRMDNKMPLLQSRSRPAQAQPEAKAEPKEAEVVVEDKQEEPASTEAPPDEGGEEAEN
ncbi:MAG: 30S ribosomal protein S6 [Anaerolineae bacterium]|nr:30S ribosomal protein S6 [Anaerolineae bacterium]